MAGSIKVVGIGPGSRDHMSVRALQALENADIVLGYATYTGLVEKAVKVKKIIASGMRQEVDRCIEALELAEQGNTVALVSGGDPGIYGMAGIMLEVLERANSDVPCEIIPGITAATAAAALLGAPLTHDFAVISLSDLLTEWSVIRKRLISAAEADFVICLYNPESRSRTEQIREARELVLLSRKESTPVGIVKKGMREGEMVVITDLDRMLDHDLDMTSVVIIGNTQTTVSHNKMITPRGYGL